MAVVGLEQPAFSHEKTANHPEDGAKSDASGALSAILTDTDDALRRLLAVWPKLTGDERQAHADHAETLSAGQLDAGTTSLP